MASWQPGRGPWTFTNLDRAFDYWPELRSVAIKQEQPDALATYDARVHLTGVNAGLVFDVEDHCEVLYRGSAIWRGHVKGTLEDQADEFGHRIYVLSGQDYTAKLDDALIRRRAKRKRERVRRRVKWLLSYLKPNIWELAGRDLSGLPSSDPFVEAYDYYGASVREGLEHVADELRLTFYVDLENIFRMFRTDTLAAPFDLDNEAPDHATTFPFREWTQDKESTSLGNAVLVEPEQRKRSRWSTDATSIAAYGRQERFVSDSNLGGKVAALNVGARSIAQGADPDVEARLVCWEPGLAPGQTVHVREALWDHDEDWIVGAVEIAGPDPHDEGGEAYLVSTVTLTDRRRPKGRHKGGGGATSGGVNKVIRDRPGATADTGPHPLDEFDRIVSPPTISDGATIVAGALTTAGMAREGRTHGASPVDIPFRFYPWAYGKPGSYLGSWYSGWWGNPYPCPGLDNSFSGYWQREQWYRFTIPAHPADMAGIKVSVSTGAPGGVQGPSYASVAPLDVVVLDYEPTALRQGIPVGQVAASGSAVVTIPAALVPAEGAQVWVGYQTSWECNRADPGNYVCGWTWPFSSYAGNTDKYGDPWGGYSGQVGVNAMSAAIWQVWDASESDLGTLATPARAPWVGGNAVTDGGTEGSPTDWQIDGEAFIVTAEEPAGKALTVVGEREDDTQAYGPWSDVQWAAEITFEIDALGDLAEAGPRNIELVTTGEGERVVGTVHLGDLSDPMGISVGGPSSLSFAARTLSVDAKWRARFDTRAGVVRGKLWLASAGEPATWDVTAPMFETEDGLDRFDLWVRVGNGAGDAQTAKIHRLRGFDGARAGQRVVKEFTGYADGLTRRFPTAHRYREDTLRVYVNGSGIAPQTQDGEGAEYTLDFWPTARSIMRATYIADDAPETEE